MVEHSVHSECQEGGVVMSKETDLEKMKETNSFLTINEKQRGKNEMAKPLWPPRAFVRCKPKGLLHESSIGVEVFYYMVVYATTSQAR